MALGGGGACAALRGRDQGEASLPTPLSRHPRPYFSRLCVQKTYT